MEIKKEHDSYHTSLKLILKNNAGKILILKDKEGGTFDGLYDLPGGRIDTDEFKTPFPEIIQRETQEEIGNVNIKLNPTPQAIGRGSYYSKSSQKEIRILYVFFEARYIDGAINISDEHEDYKWIDLAKESPKNYFVSGILEGIEMYLAH